MKIKLLMILFLCFGEIGTLFAQRVITGAVTDKVDGAPIPYVSIAVEGTTQGTTTDLHGKYAIRVDNKAKALVFSSMGYEKKVVEIDNKAIINVILTSSNVALNEVVVTALGIPKARKSLAYATNQIKGSEITAVKDASVINSLSGKVPGLVINESASGVGGSSRVTLRGNKSTRNNQPLYVIDGVPMMNYTPEQPGSPWGVHAGKIIGVDGGDAMSGINPDDIKSITVLNGASAAALYGSQAANGAIMITTKKGRVGKGKINYSSQFIVNTPYDIPKMQYKYGQTAAGSMGSWGSLLSSPAPDHVAGFFKTGSVAINSISFSKGSKQAQTFISYANTRSTGIMPNNKLDRHNFNMNQHEEFFNSKLEMNASVNYLHQRIDNTPALGLYYNSLTGLYLFPRGLDFNKYKNHYEVFSSTRNTMVQNWLPGVTADQNPYWIVNRDPNFLKRDRFSTNLTLKYHFTKDLDLIARGSLEKSFNQFDQRSYASTRASLADPNGRYVLNKTNGTQLFSNILLNYNHNFTKFSLSANLGGSIRDERIYNEYFDSKGAGLKFANIFSLQNFKQPGAIIKQQAVNSQLQSVYGSAQLGYKGLLYLSVTGRNDWSSTLPQQSYFYPSVGLSSIISDLMKVSWLDYLKVRVSYAVVGNHVDPYVANMINSIDPVTGLVVNTVGLLQGKKLVPEKSKSFETGVDMNVLNNRIRFNFTYYNTHTKNQFIKIAASLGSGYSQYLINAGDIRNEGIEMTLGFTPVKTSTVKWNADFNFTKNVNKVISLSKDLSNGVFFLNTQDANNYSMGLTVGGSFGDIYGKTFQRASNGAIIVDKNGKPFSNTGGLKFIGNPQPKFRLNMNNIISWKHFTFRFLIDGRFGGKVMSFTQAMNDMYGVSQATANARDNGGVTIKAQYANGTPYKGKLNARTFYTTVGGRAGITGYYMYDATNIRLREIAVGYRFNIHSKVINNLKLSVVGRNLFFFMNNAPFDPDITMSTATSYQGVDVFGPPSTRSFGLNLSTSF